MSLALLLLCLAVASLVYTLIWHRAGRQPAFPGPRQYPWLGRIHDLPRRSLWLRLKAWADVYGPIYQIRVLGQTFVIVSDEAVAEELLVKRGHLYSGRAQIRSIARHKEGPNYLALMDRNDTWQRQRKWVHAAMAEASRHHFYGHLEAEAHRLLAMLLLDPACFLDHTREFCGRVMSRLAWDDATLGRANGDSAEATLRCMSLPGPLTNTLTPLWHLPLPVNPWKQSERTREREQVAWWTASLQLARARYLRGDLPGDTWSFRYLEQLQAEGHNDHEPDQDGDDALSEHKEQHSEHSEQDETVFAACMLGFFNLVGVVTVTGPLKFFQMAMALHPAWQHAAQAEIDRACGDRMPSTSDFAALPIVRACIKETLRWRPGVPLGVPHQAESDDVFRGVAIKKGTVVLACEWSLTRDPARYPDPDVFHPERYLEPGWPTFMEPLSKYPNLRDGASMHTFGWGRRACVGKDLANDEMFVCCAALLWGFRWAPKTCPLTGQPVPIDTQATNSYVILEPRPFQLSIRPRSARRAQQILDGYSAVREQVRVEM